MRQLRIVQFLFVFEHEQKFFEIPILYYLLLLNFLLKRNLSNFRSFVGNFRDMENKCGGKSIPGERGGDCRRAWRDRGLWGTRCCCRTVCNPEASRVRFSIYLKKTEIGHGLESWRGEDRPTFETPLDGLTKYVKSSFVDSDAMYLQVINWPLGFGSGYVFCYYRYGSWILTNDQSFKEISEKV